MFRFFWFAADTTNNSLGNFSYVFHCSSSLVGLHRTEGIREEAARREENPREVPGRDGRRAGGDGKSPVGLHAGRAVRKIFCTGPTCRVQRSAKARGPREKRAGGLHGLGLNISTNATNNVLFSWCWREMAKSVVLAYCNETTFTIICPTNEFKTLFIRGFLKKFIDFFLQNAEKIKSATPPPHTIKYAMETIDYQLNDRQTNKEARLSLWIQWII